MIERLGCPVQASRVFLFKARATYKPSDLALLLSRV